MSLERWMEIDHLMATAVSLEDHLKIQGLLMEAFDEGMFVELETPTMDYLLDNCVNYVMSDQPSHAERALDYAAFFARQHHSKSERERWAMGHFVTWHQYREKKGF